MPITGLAEYQELALRTKNRTGVSQLPDLAVDALGLAGEAGELFGTVILLDFGDQVDRANIVKEMGDVMWYLVSMCDSLKLNMDDIDIESILWVEPTQRRFMGSTSEAKTAASHIMFVAAAIADLIKKHLGHGIELDTDAIEELLGNIVISVYDIGVELGISLDEVCRANIKKLSERYPNGFNTADSIAKKDELVEKMATGEIQMGVPDSVNERQFNIGDVSKLSDILSKLQAGKSVKITVDYGTTELSHDCPVESGKD